MAFADLNLNVGLELSPEEVGALDRVLTKYREIVGGDDATVNSLSADIKGLLSRINMAIQYLNTLMDSTFEEPGHLIEDKKVDTDGEKDGGKDGA
jgi:hypothetical protein